MKLHRTLPMRHPGIPLRDLLAWLRKMQVTGFTEDAIVKLGKTTGQQIVMCIDEERTWDDLWATQRQFSDKVEIPKRPMWPEVDPDGPDAEGGTPPRPTPKNNAGSGWSSSGLPQGRRRGP